MKTLSLAPTPVPATPSVAFPKSRVFLVDDHPITRQGLAALINHEHNLEVCGEADSSPMAIEMIQKLLPDVALVDVTLKTTSGIELMKHLKVLRPQMPVLMMSMHDESLFAERALRAGAKGYIMKLEPGSAILAAIRRTLSGELYLSEKMREKMLHRLVKTGTTEVVYAIDTLSDREMEVFQLIGNGYGTRQIAEQLHLSVKTIDSYREHLKVKLRLDSGTELVRHAIQWVKSEGIV
jgi:DNA-binding NarL/FixJ family response regulator